MLESIRRDVLIVLPVYNEEQTINTILKEIEERGWPYVVINDASCDGTAFYLRGRKKHTLEHPFRMGAWMAILTGFHYAFEKGYKVVVTLDADGQHQPQYVPDLVVPILKDEADVVIGSYVSRLPIWAKLSLSVLRRITRLPVKDLTSGFRAYNRKVVKFLMDAGLEMLDYQDIGVLLAMKGRFRLREVFVEMKPRASGKSKIFSSYLKILLFSLENLLLILGKLR